MGIKTGILLVHVALIMYSIGMISEQLKRRITNRILFFVAAGVIFDILATLFMILYSSKGLLTLHGAVGYSALLLMLIDFVWMYKFRRNNTPETIVPRNLHLFSRVAYIWWITAYITGAVLVALRHSA